MNDDKRAPAWPIPVAIIIGLSIVIAGGFVGYAIMTAEKTPTPEEILAKASTTPRTSRPAPAPKATEPEAKGPEKDSAKPTAKGDEPAKTPMTEKKDPAPAADSNPPPANTPPTLRQRDTYVKQNFKLPPRTTTEPRREMLKDVGQAVALNLVGLDEVANKIEKSQRYLSQQFQDSTLTLKVAIEGPGGSPAPLAVFQMRKDGHLSFNWTFKANNDAEGRRAADLVRDCVLEVKNNLGEVSYFSFRPVEIIKAVACDPPNVNLEEHKYDVSKPLEYNIVSKPLAVASLPVRPLVLEFETNRHPVVKNFTKDLKMREYTPDGEGTEMLPDTNSKNDLAEAGTAANYFYQRLVAFTELTPTSALRGLVVIRVEPLIDSKEMLESRRTTLVNVRKEEEAKYTELLADKVIGARSVEDLKKIRDERLTKEKEFQAAMAAIDKDIAKWKQDDQQLRRKVKPVLTIPTGVIWMKVADLRVDVYRIVEP